MTEESKMPARIWADESFSLIGAMHTEGDVAYYRADLVEAMAEALARSTVAIDDWIHQYAPDECIAYSVSETRDRIMSAGGTLAYIARTQQRNRAALTSYQESINDKA